MTKQHFIAIAETFNLSYRNAPSGQAEKILETLAINLADDFEKVNPRFSRSMFLAEALK